MEKGGYWFWKGNDWSGPRSKLSIIDSTGEQSFAAVDFYEPKRRTLPLLRHTALTVKVPYHPM